MSKKRKTFRKSRFKRHKQNSRVNRHKPDGIILENILLGIIYSALKPPTAAEIFDHVPPGKYSIQGLDTTLTNLVRASLIKKTGRNRYQIHPKAQLYTGLMSQHSKGFGFVEVDDQSVFTTLTRDPFIARTKMANAIHGDRVLIRLLRIRDDNRPEAAVVRVLQQGSDTLCGRIQKDGKFLRVVPDDIRFPFKIHVPYSPEHDVVDGDIVKVRFSRGLSMQKSLTGEIVEHLGQPNSIDTQSRLVSEKFDLPHQFSKTAVEEAEKCRQFPHNLEERRDLRHLDHVTIDGETAKDFDDAIFVSQNEEGFQLYVSIADVSFYVRTDSHLDREAFERGTSVYFPGTVIPMLPETLSNDLCSLKPHEDRLTVTAQLKYDKEGNLLESQFYRSQINSKYRFTYTEVAEILKKASNEIEGRYQNFWPQLHVAEQLAVLLREMRLSRGAIDFNLREAEISISPKNKVSNIHPIERNFAHKMIEEFMLAANESVATFLQDNCRSPLFRIHELPNEEKLDESIAFFKTLGLEIPPFAAKPVWFAKVLRSVRASRYEYIVNNLLLRTMSQARYSVSDAGHFGLASPTYTHFTSPIRRYPDLIIHRQLIEVLQANKSNCAKPVAPLSTKEAGDFLSTRERVAVDAERDMQARLKILYMREKIGEEFPAVISGVTENMLFIEIESVCTSGVVPIELLGNDYYIFDKPRFRLFGEITAKTYQIGDVVEVVLLEANLSNQKLTFAIKQDN